MSIFSYFKTLFAAPSCPSYVAPQPIPPPPALSGAYQLIATSVAPESKPAKKKDEPSCFAKGIAAAWIKGEGWVVKRPKETVDEYILTGSKFVRLVELTNKSLDIKIELAERKYTWSSNKAHIGLLQVAISGANVISFTGNYYSASVDKAHIEEAIMSHPYPALKRLQTIQAKEDVATSKWIKAIEELGCPKEGSTL